MLSATSMRTLPTSSTSRATAPLAPKTSIAPISRVPRLAPCTATRAPSGFNLFTKERYTKVRDELVAKGKPAKLADVNSIIRGEWQAMPDKGKQPYMMESEKRKGEVASVKAAEKEKAGPSKPPSSYALFTKEQFPLIKAKNPEAKLPEITKQISKLWKEMPEAEKSKRLQAAAKQAEEYKAAKEAHGNGKV